jgi:hypothetical protein
MGILEWIGAHFLGPLVSLYRTIQNKPRPELKIHELVPTGGSAGVIDFNVIVQNVGTKSARGTITARVGEGEVQVVTPVVELLPNAPSKSVQIRVPRPQLGELIKAFNLETTLYGRELMVELAEGKHRATQTWSEHVYSREENSIRHEIQQREWRFGLGTATPDDDRADRISDVLRGE